MGRLRTRSRPVVSVMAAIRARVCGGGSVSASAGSSFRARRRGLAAGRSDRPRTCRPVTLRRLRRPRRPGRSRAKACGRCSTWPCSGNASLNHQRRPVEAEMHVHRPALVVDGHRGGDPRPEHLDVERRRLRQVGDEASLYRGRDHASALIRTAHGEALRSGRRRPSAPGAATDDDGSASHRAGGTFSKRPCAQSVGTAGPGPSSHAARRPASGAEYRGLATGTERLDPEQDPCLLRALAPPTP